MPISDDLQLDLTEALAQVDALGVQLDAALQQATTGLAAGLQDAVATPLEPTLDAAPVEAELAAALATAGATPIEVEADTAQLGGTIDEALNAVQGTVAVDADTAPMVADIDAAAAGATATVTVEADTTQAEQDITDLGDAATAATGSTGGGGTDGLSSSLSGLGGVAAGGAGGSISALTSSLGTIPVIGTAAAVAIGVLGKVTDDYFNSAVSATAGTQRFNQQFGDLADETQQIDVGGVNTSLAELNSQLGSSTTQTRNALSNLALLGNQSGATADQVSVAGKQLAALAANAAAANPQLGSVGDVASKLDRLLGRGGPRLAQYGISLSSVDINARAADIALARGSGTITEFDKRAAGAALATEKLGTGLQDNLANAAQNPIIQLRELSHQFEVFITDLGRPLIAPVFEILTQAQPVILSVARLFGVLIQAILPIAGALVTAFAPLLSGLFNTIGSVISSFIPLFQQAGNVIQSLLAPALAALAPLLSSIVGLFSDIAVAVQPVVDAAVPLADLFGRILGFLAEGAGLALSAVVDVLARIVQALTPLIEATNTIGNIVKVLQFFGVVSADAAGGAGKLGDQVKANVKDLADLQAQVADTDDKFAHFIATESQFATTGNILDELRRVGISMQQLKADLANGEQGFKDFIAAAIDAGQVKIQVDGADVSSASIRELDGSLVDYLNTSGAAVTQGGDLVAAFTNQAAASEKQAQANFNVIASQQGLTDAQEATIGATAKAAFGVDTYANRLLVLADTTGTLTAAEKSAVDQREAAAQQQQRLADGLGQLATAALGAGVSEADLKAKSEELGISQDKLKAFVDSVGKAFTDFKNTLVANLPAVQDVLSKVGDAFTQGTNPQKLIDQLNQDTQALVSFQENVQFLIDAHLTSLATVAAQKGPEFTNAIVNSIKNGRAGLGEELNNNIAVYQQNLTNTENFLTNTAAPALFDQSKALGEASTTAFGGAVNFPAGVTVSMGQVPGAIATAQPGVTQAAGASGQATTDEFGNKLTPASQVDQQFALAQSNLVSVGLAGAPLMNASGTAGFNVAVAFGKGMAIGLNAQADSPGGGEVGSAARHLVDVVDREIRAEAGIHSPSTLTAQLGGELSAGLAQGISGATHLVLDAVDQQLGVVEKFTQTRVNGVVETVRDFIDGGFIVSVGGKIDRAQSDLRGLAGEAADSLAATSRPLDDYTSSALQAADASNQLAASLQGVGDATPHAFLAVPTRPAGVAPLSPFAAGASGGPSTVNLNLQVVLPVGVTAADADVLAGAISGQVQASVAQVFSVVAKA